MTINAGEDTGALSLERAVGLIDAKTQDDNDVAEAESDDAVEQDAPEPDDAEPQDEVSSEDEAAAEDAGTEQDSEAATTADEDGSEAENEPGDAEEEAEEQDAPEQVTVDAPAWWNAEAKAEFAKLPPELQKVVQEQESTRERLHSTKTQELAETKKKVETETQNLVQLNTAMAQILSTAKDTFASKWANVDWSAWADADPEAAFKGRLQYDSEQRQIQDMQAAQRAATEKQREEFVRTESEKLKAIAPDLYDPQQGEERRRAVGQFLIERGATPDELANVDARLLSLAYDAKRYRDLVAKMAATPSPKNQSKPKQSAQTQKKPIVRPTAAQPQKPARERATAERAQRFARTGSLDDAVALLNART